MKKEIWVIVANSSCARIFRLDSTKSLTEIETFIHTESRLQSHDLVSDQPGRAYESAGVSRHAIEPPNSPQKQEFINFSKKVADYLDLSRAQGKFSHFYLAASPAFLGLLRNSLSTPTLNVMAAEVDKDLIHHKPHEISQYFNFSFIN